MLARGPAMRIVEPLVEAVLVRRYKRFLMDVRLDDGRTVTIHCPNSGSMEGCLREGARVKASVSANAGRKYPLTAEWVEMEDGWVGINTHRTNLIVEEALREGAIPEFSMYRQVRREVAYGGDSRIDFLLEGDGLPPCYVEVKNTTWPTPDGGVGFPDAVTERGLKHLKALERMVRMGARGAVVFLINRSLGPFFRAASEKDPEYSLELRRVALKGVEILPYRAAINPPEVRVAGPVVWSGAPKGRGGSRRREGRRS